MKQALYRLKKLAQTPIPDVYRYVRHLVKKRSVRTKPSVLAEELLNVPNELAFFPTGFFRAQLHASKETAERIVNHEFNLLGSGPKKLGKHIDWHRDFIHDVSYPLVPSHKLAYDFSGGQDIKVPWELSRFQFLPQLARASEVHHDENYAREARELVHDWITKNPVGIGVNWKCPMDCAIRVCNWTFAWELLRDTDVWRDTKWQHAFYTSLVEHGKFIFDHLEYGPGFNSNHFLADITGLLYLGILFPEFRDAEKWKKFALRWLEREIQKQVYADGVNFEASIAYHRLVTELFGYSALLCRENNIELSSRYWLRLEKMFEFAAAYTKPSGLAPQIGDNDDGRLFIFEDFYDRERRDHRHLFWLEKKLFPDKQSSAANGSRAFPHGGIYIMRKENFYCIVDGGGNGQAGNAGHAHNDTLSFELSMLGEDFIVDPGTYVYTSDPAARNHFRSTRMHNTVMVDNEEMNRFRSDTLFSMHDDAKPRVRAWHSDAASDLLDAEHNGYARLKDPIIHQRSFLFDKKKQQLELTDSFRGKGKHTLEWNFHFDIGVRVTLENGTVKAEKNKKNMTMLLPSLLHRHAEIHEDFVSPSYGIKQKANVLRLSGEIDVVNAPSFRFFFCS